MTSRCQGLFPPCTQDWEKALGTRLVSSHVRISYRFLSICYHSVYHWLLYTTDTFVVSTVFLRHRKTGFELPVSFFVYPLQRKTEFEIPFSFFVFRFPTTLKIEFQLLFSLFVFPQPWRAEFLLAFLFQSFFFVRYWKSKFELRFSFSISEFLSLSFLFYLYRRNVGTSCR